MGLSSCWGLLSVQRTQIPVFKELTVYLRGKDYTIICCIIHIQHKVIEIMNGFSIQTLGSGKNSEERE